MRERYQDSALCLQLPSLTKTVISNQQASRSIALYEKIELKKEKRKEKRKRKQQITKRTCDKGEPRRTNIARATATFTHKNEDNRRLVKRKRDNKSLVKMKRYNRRLLKRKKETKAGKLVTRRRTISEAGQQKTA
jgi:hypothetical protein